MSNNPATSSHKNKVTPGGKFRWTICTLLFFSVAINYIDRNVIGILKGPLSEKLGWNDTDFGYIVAAFNFAYAFGYLLGGRIVDRLGIKRALPWFVFLWSFAACAHGLCNFLDVTARVSFHYPWFDWAEKTLIMATFAAPLTVFGFMGARVALGLTEGGNFPAAIKTVAEWFPVKERALATGWFNAGTNAGAIIGVGKPRFTLQVRRVFFGSSRGRGSMKRRRNISGCLPPNWNIFDQIRRRQRSS